MLLTIYYCIILHTNNFKPTFASPYKFDFGSNIKIPKNKNKYMNESTCRQS